MALQNLLKPFIKPKWQHKKPEIRKLGLRLLDIKKSDDAVVIEKLALADEDADVRRLAVKRLIDLDKLSQVVANDGSEKVRHSAETRYNHLFSGIEKDAPALTDRLARLQSLTNKKFIEYLCTHSVEMELRLAALVYLDKESILGDIAINDPEQQVRIAAVDRVDQQSTLERVLKKVRSKDKKVSKQVKQKLAAIASDQERPLRLKQRAKQCCIELEAMITARDPGRDLGNTEIRIKEIESNWQASKQEWEAEIGTSWDGELAKRYTKAHGIAVNKFQEFEKHAERLRVLEAVRYPLRTEKKALCKVLEDKLLHFKNSDLPVTDIKAQIKLEIESKRLNWNSLSDASGQLSRQEEESLKTRFNSACHALDQYIETLEQQQRLRDTLKALIESTNQQTGHKEPVDLKKLKSLQSHCEKLKHSVAHVSALVSTRNASDLNSDLDLLTQRIAKLRERHLKEQQARQQNIEKFKNFVDLLQQALQQGNSQQALKLQRQTQKLIKNMPKQDVHIVRKQGDERRFQTLVKRIDELRDWKRWASTPLKETLLKEMEALVNELNGKQGEIDISQLSAQVRQARDQWKKLGESEPDSAEELWERFNNACNQAYEPCQHHFDKQKHVRQENLIKRQVICNELQQFLSSTDWENLNGDLSGDFRDDDANLGWKKAERLLRVAQQEWNNAGSIEKKAWSAINKQFHDAMAMLRQKTNEERARNADLKERLIQQLNAVIASLEGVTGESPELNDAIEKVKKLQAKWKVLGAASHESKLWTQFRASCDIVFNLRQAHFQAKDQEKKENLLAKEAICELIEAISGRTGDALKLSRTEFENAKKTWVNTGPIEKESVNKVNKRYKEVLDQYEKMQRQRIANEQQQQLNILIHKVKLCGEVESLFDDVIEKKREIDDAMKYLQLIQAKWQESLALDDKMEQAVLIRFQNAIDELIELSRRDSHELSNKFLDMYQSRRQANLKNRQLICIRMEILAGVASPEEDQQARMEYQVMQLADKMKQGDIQDKAARQNTDLNNALSLLHDWSIAGPVSRTELNRLTQRFDSARSIFLQEF